MAKITQKNYHEGWVASKYLSCTQIKSWAECEASAHAKYTLGESKWDGPSEAMLLGSYLDETLLSGDVAAFEEANREKLFTLSGSLRAGFDRINDMAERCNADPRFMAAIDGEHQVIMQGVIAGTPTRIMIDALPSAMPAIVDLKKMARTDKKVWSDREGGMVEWWRAYGYHWQAAIYREIYRQNTGDDLPFILAVVEAEPPHQTFGLPLAVDCMHEIESVVDNIRQVRQGREPRRCGSCKWCKASSVFEIRDPEYI